MIKPLWLWNRNPALGAGKLALHSHTAGPEVQKLCISSLLTENLNLQLCAPSLAADRQPFAILGSHESPKAEYAVHRSQHLQQPGCDGISVFQLTPPLARSYCLTHRILDRHETEKKAGHGCADVMGCCTTMGHQTSIQSCFTLRPGAVLASSRFLFSTQWWA